ncbi:MAG: hypothetical protein HFH87_10940 [Lachnospiraceae bacterium]|nr:hypothetical protein [Lachnospiraceae bacterium]
MNYRRVKYGAAGLMIAGMLALTGCGSQGDAADTEQTSESISQETEKEAQQPTETSSEATEESSEATEEAQSTDAAAETTENTDAAENAEAASETPKETEAAVPIQGKYPVQISQSEANGVKKNYFFDEDGDLIRLETENADGTVSTEETEYILDGQGNKVYGLTKDSLTDPCNWIDYSAATHKIAENPLVQTIKSTHSEQGGTSETAFSYDADNRITNWTKSTIYDPESEKEDYTYEEQDGNLIATLELSNGGTHTLQYNRDGYLTLESGRFENSSFDYSYEWSYDENNRLTAVNEKNAVEEKETQITLDEAGNILRVTFSEGFVWEYEGYDTNGNWMTCTYYIGDGKMDCFLVSEYDDSGNILTKSFGIGSGLRTVSYDYDAEGRLNAVNADDVVLYQFGYNSEGMLESMEKVNEYEKGDGEKAAEIYGYVLEQEMRQDVVNYVEKYTGIGSGSDSVINYFYSAVFSY